MPDPTPAQIIGQISTDTPLEDELQLNTLNRLFKESKATIRRGGFEDRCLILTIGRASYWWTQEGQKYDGWEYDLVGLESLSPHPKPEEEK